MAVPNSALSGLQFLRDLCVAIGIDPDAAKVARIVLECDVSGIPTIYIKQYVDAEIGKKITDQLRVIVVDELADVGVDKDGYVIHTKPRAV